MPVTAELRLVDRDAPAVGGEVEARVLDAALVLVARWGVKKTSLADVAREAGCSRATVYRAFPGGKQHLLMSLAERELRAYLAAIVEAVDSAPDLEGALTRAVVVAARLLRDHDAAQFVLDHEPELLLPCLGFKRVDVLYRTAAAEVGPHLERFVSPERAAWAAEWSARLFLSYLFNPHRTDLAVVDDASRLVRTFVLPAFTVTTT